MSIIFKKLNTLKNDYSIGPEEFKRQGLHNGTPVYTFKNIIFSPKGALIIAATLFAFGMISFYALSLLKGYLDSASGNAIVVQHQTKAMLPGNPPTTESGNFSPPRTDSSEEPAQAPEADAVPGVAPAPGGAPPESVPDKSSGFKVPKYFTRLLNKNNKDASLIHSDDPVKDPEKELLYIPKQILDASSDEKAPALLKKPVVPKPPTGSDPPAKNSKILSRLETAPSEIKIKAQEEALRAVQEKRTRKTSAVSLLAEDLEEAIEKKDSARTHTLFEALAKENGPNSPYYLKLKAFQDIREENYDSAKKFLNQVLAKDMNDFDANYNMAIIEIREKKFDDARQRLTRLKEIHPSRAHIDDLLNSF